MLNTRVRQVHKAPENGTCVVYVMSRDQRVDDNFALLAAQAKALKLQLPLYVVFILRQKSGIRAHEHASFMLQGLAHVAKKLKLLDIQFYLISQSSGDVAWETLGRFKPAAVYFDYSPLHEPRQRLKDFARVINVACYVVDTHNIIPVWIASDHQEFAAHTFRFKVHAHLADYLVEPAQLVRHPHRVAPWPESLTTEQAFKAIGSYPKRDIQIDYESGEQAARQHLKAFINEHLSEYAVKRNDIAHDYQSGLSPYLHFGQIASIRVALDVMYAVNQEPLLIQKAKMASAVQRSSNIEGMNALFEEMIVRKELADNFCHYAGDYKSFDAVPIWAKDTLALHETDVREHVYAKQQLTHAQTHDSAWNAAQTELTTSGKIHGYMRMYWAKKILEWTSSPQEALDVALYLNDAYSIDGGDPNGYVGILWAIAGLHDRPWVERPIFGKVRYMNQAGLYRKFDVDKYIQRVSAVNS